MNLHKIVILVCVQMLLLSFSAPVMGGDDGEEKPLGELTLRVGAQDDGRTRNILGSRDMWTSNVLSPVYQAVGVEDPSTEEPIPYLLKGIDADEDGMLNLDEYGVYRRVQGTPPEEALEVTAYYDFTGVYSHDGIQMTIHDLLFSYHVRALDPLESKLDVIKDKNNLPGTNYTTSRWLHVWPVQGNWDPAIPIGDSLLTFSLHFSQQANYANFVKYTLNGATVMPRHVWEGTGKICLDATNGTCTNWKENIHSNFGYAYDNLTWNGVPAASPNAFRYYDAETWTLTDDEVIGTGAFEFDNWVPGISVKLTKYEDYYGDALDCAKVGDPPVCQGTFFNYMHQPYIDGMLFLIYKTPQAAVFALQAGEIDVISWSVPPDFVADLVADPNVEISASEQKGFHYLGYNMRKSPFGYPSNDPLQGDHGYYLRKAMAHVIDKNTIVTTLLQNFGVAGDQPVNPAFTRWYNGSVVKYNYNLSAASQILDDHYTNSFQGGPGLGWSGGWRNLPTIGSQQVEILCPQADYDHILAQACEMIATNARAVGLNIVAKLLAFGQIVEKLNNREMDMWVLGLRISSDPPEYYTDFFYSRNAPAGLNFAGFQNETFDDLVLGARAELDPDAQAGLIKECSGLLADALPYDVIFYRTNIEAFRSDRFVNWTVGPAGSIFGESFWSWIGIHPPFLISADVVFPNGSNVNETETLVFEISVTDNLGAPVDGANVLISCDPAGPLISPTSGVTVGGSIGPISFTAPEVTSNEFYAITVQADYLAFSDSDTDYILVLNVDPIPPEILNVIAQPDPQVLGGAVNISATVLDESLVLVTCQIIDPNFSELENWTMQYDAMSDRYYCDRTYSVLGTYQFTIWAYDNSFNLNSTSGTFRIIRPPPTISDVEWDRLSQNIPTYVNISARIDSPFGIVSAWARVWDPDGQEIGNFSMESAGSTIYWKAVAAETIGEFQFHLSANDTYGTWTGYDSVFQITDVISPTADAGPDQIVYQGDTVQFDGTQSSDNWVVESYTWTFYNGTDVVTLYGRQPQSRFIHGGSFLVILDVRDPAGNDDQDYLLVQVIVADTDGDGLSDWDEENTYGTDPSKADTDGDGMNDGAEVGLGRDPLTADKEEKPFEEEFWWILLLLAIVFLVALVLTILFTLLVKKPEKGESAEETEDETDEDAED